MLLQKLKIKNYKNLSDIELPAFSKINCFIGKNGAGKTNILDAIFYVASTRSYFNHIDTQNIKYGENYFFIEAEFEKDDGKHTVTASFSAEKSKSVKLNSKKIKRLSELYGQFPVVIVTPYDVNLILEGSEIRRNFVDAIISLYDKAFLQNLISYKKILVQRNALLKKFAQNRVYDKEYMAIFDDKIVELSPKIYDKRKDFIVKFLPIFQNYYNKISGNDEKVGIFYKSDLNELLISDLLQGNIKKDLALERTSAGVHKDDFVFTLNEKPLKKHASQGQQKSFLLALKFAQNDFLKQYHSAKPVMLLDDIFDKLDTSRVENIVKIVAGENFGQIFITHTDSDKLKDILRPLEKYFFFEVENGKVKML